ncbi:MAG: M50 family metallopeptidase [Acholeplasmataceae bacterium]
MKAFIKAIRFISIALFIGFFMAFSVYQGYIETIRSGLEGYGFFGVLFLLILVFYITLTLHELGHFLAFRLQKIRLRAIYLTIFVFYRTEQGWRFTVRPRLWVLFGGLVVPDLAPINDEKTYQKTVDRFSKALLAGPIVTIVFAVLVLILFWLVLIFAVDPFWIGTTVYFTVFTLLLSGLYTYTFFLSTNVFFGDFVAYRHMKEDPIFQLIEIDQYTVFSLHEQEETTDFLFSKIKRVLRETELDYSVFHALLINAYLEGVMYGDKQPDEAVDQKILRRNIRPYMRFEQGIETAHALACYHYFKKDVARAYELLDRIRQGGGKSIPEKLKVYLIKRSEHAMHLKDHASFLADRENVHIGHFWIFDGLIDPYEHMKALHEPLPFSEYTSSIEYIYADSEKEKSDS